VRDRLQAGLTEYPNAVAISARTGAGIEGLLAALEQVLRNRMVPVDLLIPYANGDLVALAHAQGYVEHEEHTETGTHLRGRVPIDIAGRYAPFWTDRLDPFHTEESDQ
jgi:GTPase